MARRRSFWLRTILLTLVVLPLLAGLAGWLYWQQLRERLGIERLALSGVELGLDQLSITDLQADVNRPGLRMQLHGRDLRLAWRRTAELGWHLQTLQLQQLRIVQQAPLLPAPATDESEGLHSLDPAQLLPAALPRQLVIPSITLDLPCRTTRCRLQGALRLDQAPDPQLHVRLDHATHRLDLHAWKGASPLPTLEARLEIDGEPGAHLRSTWHATATGNTWSGKLELPARGDTAWLWQWLEEWTGALPPLNQAPGHLALSADWLLQLAPGALDSARLLDADGHVDLRAELPAPWPLPGVGPLQGQAVVQLFGSRGRWQARQLQAQLKLLNLDPQLLKDLPRGIDPGSLDLQIGAEEHALAADSLGLTLQLASSGPLRIEGEAKLQALLDPERWEMRVTDARLQARASEVRHADVQLQGMQARLAASGLLDRSGLQLSLQPGSRLQASQLKWLDPQQPLSARQLHLQLDGLQLAPAPSQGYKLVSPIDLRLDALEHRALRNQAWRWRGSFNLDGQWALDGQLSNDGGLSLRTRVTQTSGGLVLDGQLDELRLGPDNPLERSLADWPPALELNAGSLRLQARATLPAQGPVQARAAMDLKGVAGLFDRSELQGLDAAAQLDLGNEQLRLTIEQLQIARLNPGVPLEAVQLRGDYQAALAAPGEGRLSWQQAQAQLFDGRLWLDPAELALDQRNPARSLHVQGVSLEQLLRAYPAEGLEGQGRIDGELPLLLTPDGFSIEGGQLAARPPGGRLHFSSPKLRAFGASNPAMGLVVQALDNFHYSRLESGVDYSEQGTLRLALRLEGRNPQIENGRPIHFNINIEEDIPALLTSLQLSGKVSERIQQRVQERMRQAEPATP